MLFNSLSFLWFLPLVFAGWKLLNVRWKPIWLLAASYFFYMQGGIWFGGLLLVTTLVDWFVALQLEKANSQSLRKRWLLASIISNLGVLVGFKYTAFFYNTGLWLSGNGSDYISNFIVPAGLSFYTFQSLSYTIDVYRGTCKAETSLVKFALFVSFFPQLVAGPVERYNHLSNQLSQPKGLTAESLAAAGRMMIWGFFKKIAIADNLASYVDPLFTTPEQYGSVTLALGGFLFAVQVYCDFSGYTAIATGTARLFGIELMLNWRRPLLSRSLHEFWQRNHISMTSWFRDYLYKPLGGSRAKPWRVQVNLFLTFLISGLWHGASWAFVIWGALHGVAYLIERAVFNYRKPKTSTLLKFQGWLWLIVFHCLSIIAFRAGNGDTLQRYTTQLWKGNWSVQTAFTDFRQMHDLFPLLVDVALILLLFAKELQEEYGWLRHRNDYATLLRPAFYVGLFVVLFFIGEFGSKAFIYFSF